MGQTETLSHLAPFVDVSRQKIKSEVTNELISVKSNFSEEEFNSLIDRITQERLKEEIKRGVQTIQYQILTLMTSNGKVLPL